MVFCEAKPVHPRTTDADEELIVVENFFEELKAKVGN